MTIKLSNDREWLERMANDEDYGPVSAGGLLAEALTEWQSHSDERELRALGRLVELARRRQGLSLPQLAKRADVELSGAVVIKTSAAAEPQPRALYGLAKALDLPSSGLMELAGLVKRRDDTLTAAAVRFAARAEPMDKLSPEERDALEEFVRVLAESSDRK